MGIQNVQTPREQAVELALEFSAEIDEVQKRHRLPRQEAFARVIERRQLAKNFSLVPREETRHKVPGSRFWGSMRAAALMAIVNKCRHEVFRSKNVPFETREAANAWLEARARWGSSKSQMDALRRLDRFVEKAYKRLQTLGPPPKPYRINLQVEAYTLDWGIGYQYPVTDALMILKRHVEQIVRHTGWTEAETLDLVLLDASPREELRVSATVHVPPRDIGSTPLRERLYQWQTFTITGIRPWHLHRNIFEGLVQQVRRQAFFRSDARDDLPLRDRLLLDAVVMVGDLPPPSQGQGTRVKRTEYWEQLCMAWVKLTGRQVRADAVRKRWTRLEDSRENVRKMLEDVIESRHADSQAQQENKLATPRRQIRKRSRRIESASRRRR